MKGYPWTRPLTIVRDGLCPDSCLPSIDKPDRFVLSCVITVSIVKGGEMNTDKSYVQGNNCDLVNISKATHSDLILMKYLCLYFKYQYPCQYTIYVYQAGSYKFT